MHVYKITNTVNGKIYIGITTCSVAKRWREHKCNANIGTNGYLYRAMRRHGFGSFRIECVYQGVSLIEIAAVEKGLIAQYGATNRTKGYNRTSGGEGCPMVGRHPNVRSILTEEAVRFMRNPALSGMVNRELLVLVNSRFGLNLSRDAIRDARRGDTWRHLNQEVPPIRARQGSRTSERKRAAGRYLMTLPHMNRRRKGTLHAN